MACCSDNGISSSISSSRSASYWRAKSHSAWVLSTDVSRAEGSTSSEEESTGPRPWQQAAASRSCSGSLCSRRAFQASPTQGLQCSMSSSCGSGLHSHTCGKRSLKWGSLSRQPQPPRRFCLLGHLHASCSAVLLLDASDAAWGLVGQAAGCTGAHQPCSAGSAASRDAAGAGREHGDRCVPCQAPCSREWHASTRR